MTGQFFIKKHSFFFALRLFFVVFFAAFIIFSLHNPVLAKRGGGLADLLRQYNDWGAYRKDDICFVTSEPESSKPTNVRRGATYVFVIHRPKQRIFDEVSITAGYPYKKDSKTTSVIGSKKFRFFTIDENAWLDTANEEQKIIKAMKKGAKMIVKGLSSRGTRTTDVYSLKGFTSAMRLIDRTCKKK